MLSKNKIEVNISRLKLKHFDRWIEKNLEAIRFQMSTKRLALEMQRTWLDDEDGFYDEKRETLSKRALRATYANDIMVAAQEFRSPDTTPLCDVNGNYWPFASNKCKRCPWVVFIGEPCFMTDHYDNDSIRKRLRTLESIEAELIKRRQK